MRTSQRPRELSDLLPNPEDLLRLSPEELAWVLLQVMKSDQQAKHFNLFNFCYSLFNTPGQQQYPQERSKEVMNAVAEAWGYLESQGLVVTEPDNNAPGWRIISRRGRNIQADSDFQAYRSARLLPKELLHPTITEKVYALFLRGDYDTAVFQAFKEVEIAVRTKGGFGDNDIGVVLMRKAFHAENGSLTAKEAQVAEREALRDLFAGAIGSYKNPQSHRHVAISDPSEAIEMILLASHLLRIVDSRGAQ